MPSNHDAELAAREAGLERLLALDPDLVGRAHAQARGFAARLQRPDDPGVEPAHVYRPGGGDE